MTNDASSGFQAIADAVDPSTLQHSYASAVGGILKQNGWDLTWFGLATAIGAIFICRMNDTAIWVTALIGGLADLGYLLFVDVLGHVNFIPGTVMTLVSGTAIALSFVAWTVNHNLAIASKQRRT